MPLNRGWVTRGYSTTLEVFMHDKNKSRTIINMMLMVAIVGILFTRFSGINDHRPGGQTSVGVEDYGDRWPFQLEEVILACPSPDRVILYNSATMETYALSQAASDFGGGWYPYQTLLRPGASDEIIPELLRRGLKLCPPRRT
ncbi:DUF2511 domain-containing protein [Deinococcus marmoris]|uniref:DUF2511 domain-containing protein n=1 Tax=Deinococcus marmoris TaxID=249408 RepID=UPI000495AB05|nr:DUF2511 domain-containing protein [Deinococcus marmoris]